MSKVTHQETKYATDVILVCEKCHMRQTSYHIIIWQQTSYVTKRNKATIVICDKHNKVTNVICDKHNEATNVICDTHNKQHKK